MFASALRCAYLVCWLSVLVRNKKRSHSTAVGASLMSNKKVSSLVNKVRCILLHLFGYMLHLFISVYTVSDLSTVTFCAYPCFWSVLFNFVILVWETVLSS